MEIKAKRRGFGLEMRTFKGKAGRYLVFQTRDGAFHVFKEVEAKEAASDCGEKIEGNTRQMWKEVWYRKRKISK